MHSIIPATQGITAVVGSDKEQGEMAQKTAALWIQYSYFSVNRNNGIIFPENGGMATAPLMVEDADGNVAEQSRRVFF